jgi:acetate kinase
LKVLALNCGSSTLKFKVFELSEGNFPGKLKRMAYGVVERIGGFGPIKFIAESGECLQKTELVNDHFEATRQVIGWLRSLGFMERDGLSAVGHRVVHGGHRFTGPVLIGNEVLDSIEALKYLAPLHNEPSLMAIRAAREILGSSIPMVAVFDTAFHSKMPMRASCYALSQEMGARHHVKRYGFHGIAHRYMVERYADMTPASSEQVRLITLQLGNGCSAAAVEGGHSIDTSMGFTPLEGLMMGTRSGDVDPHLPGFLAKHEGLDIEEVEVLLNTKSGLLGVSERSQDLRELLEAEKHGDTKAALAVEMFCYRVRKQIGAYLAALGGADAVIFGGGIGENSPPVRARICAGMEWCGLILDEAKNNGTIGTEERISADHAKMQTYVIPVDEEMIIARDTRFCLGESRK